MNETQQDYIRRIHWWVRLFGVLQLVGIAYLALVLVVMPALQANEFDRIRTRIDVPAYTPPD